MPKSSSQVSYSLRHYAVPNLDYTSDKSMIVVLEHENKSLQDRLLQLRDKYESTI